MGSAQYSPSYRPASSILCGGQAIEQLENACEKLRERFGLSRVVLVGGRGMLTEARIGEELEAREGLDWVSALRGAADASVKVSVEA